MIITAVKIRKLENTGNKMIGVCSITLDNLIAIHDIKILKKDGMFLAMPSRKTSGGEYKDVAHPISPEFRTELQDKILAEYEAGHIEEASADD